MPTALPLIILLQHDRWASDALLDACEPLSDEQMQQSFEMGLGTLRATLVHMLGAMQGWGDLLAGRERRPFLEEGTCSRTEMRTMLHELADDLEQSAGAAPLTDTVSAERGGMAYTFARGAVLTHVTTHSMHHRAQAINMLRHMGVDALPMSSVMEWANTVDHPPVAVEGSG